MRVTALDFSQVALEALLRYPPHPQPTHSIHTVQHDVRTPLPFPDASFDACYAHMLYCMDFTLDELATLTAQIRRVFKPGGILVYTARTTVDPDLVSASIMVNRSTKTRGSSSTFSIAA